MGRAHLPVPSAFLVLVYSEGPYGAPIFPYLVILEGQVRGHCEVESGLDKVCIVSRTQKGSFVNIRITNTDPWLDACLPRDHEDKTVTLAEQMTAGE